MNKTIKRLFPLTGTSYPLMRDPQRQPKCYELTDQERDEAVRKTDALLKEKRLLSTPGYYGPP
jgi:hypothetical protein